VAALWEFKGMGRYRFHRCQVHRKLPNLQGWYLEIHPDDIETLIKIHRGVTYLYFAKFGLDPHIKKESAENILYHPIRLAATWLVTIERYLLNKKTVLVNANGGMMPYDGAIILETTESDDIAWDVCYDDEQIMISRWPQGKHYYLSSNKNRIFVPEKHISYEAARQIALRFVSAEHIRSQC
jgi:hypothetical protein